MPPLRTVVAAGDRRTLRALAHSHGHVRFERIAEQLGPLLRRLFPASRA